MEVMYNEDGSITELEFIETVTITEIEFLS